MRAALGIPDATAIRNGGLFRPRADGAEKNFRRPLFGQVARLCWPENTDAHLAAIARKDVRTARNWLAGKTAAPGVVIAAIVVEITRR